MELLPVPTWGFRIWSQGHNYFLIGNPSGENSDSVQSSPRYGHCSLEASSLSSVQYLTAETLGPAEMLCPSHAPPAGIQSGQGPVSDRKG